MEHILSELNIWVIGGISLVLLIAFDVFQSIIVPRQTSRKWRLAPFLIGSLAWPAFKRVTLCFPERSQGRLFASFAPSCFIVLLITWAIALIGGFGMALYGLRYCVKPPIETFTDALYFASTSFLTLGFGDLVAAQSSARIIVITAAMMGLVFMALEISFLFTLQSYLQLREQTVSTLLSRAGTPASGLVLLLRYRELNIVKSFPESFIQWEAWVATILESHRAFPILAYFRSNSSRDSWLTSMGAILDASTFLSTTLEDETVGEAELFYWLATTTLKSIFDYLQLKPYEGEHLGDEEFLDSLELLHSSGFKTKNPNDCKEKFMQRRAGYMRFLIPIAETLVLPLPLLIQRLPVLGAAKAAAKLPTVKTQAN